MKTYEKPVLEIKSLLSFEAVANSPVPYSDQSDNETNLSVNIDNWWNYGD